MIHFSEQRVFTYDGANLLEVTRDLNDYNANPLTLTLSPTKYLYVLTSLPFSVRYFDVSGPTNIQASLKLELFNGDEFEDSQSLFDFTDNQGTLKESGPVFIAQKHDFNLQKVHSSLTQLPHFSGFDDLDDYYFTRISTSTEVSLGLNYIGHKLCSESDIEALYPHLKSATLKNRFTGSNYSEQIFIASAQLVEDLIQKGIINTFSQLTDIEKFKFACAHLTASIIYRGLGLKNYKEEYLEAKASYEDQLKKRFYKVDKNMDGELSAPEIRHSQSFGRR